MMQKLLENLKLIQHKSYEFNIPKAELVKRLKNKIGYSRLETLTSIGETFKRSDYKYKGFVSNYSFEIMQRRRYNNRFYRFTTAFGELEGFDEKTMVKIKVKSFSNKLFLFPIYSFFPIFIFLLISSSTGINSILDYLIPFMFWLVFNGIAISIYILFMRNLTTTFIKEFEEDLLIY